MQSLGQASLDDVIETLTEIRAGKTPSLPTAPIPTQPIAKAVARVAEKPPATRRIPHATPSLAVPADRSPAGNAVELWQRVVGDVRSSRPLIRSWLESGQPVSLEGNVLIVGFHPKHRIVIESLSTGSNRQFLEESLARNAGRPIRLKMEIRDDVPESTTQPPAPAFASTPAGPAGPAATAAVESSDPLERFRNDPLIRQALDIFEAEIVSFQPAPAK